MRPRIGWAALLMAVVPLQVSGQGLAERVAAVENGTARFTYATRPGVEVCDQGIRMGPNRMWWRSQGPDDEPTGCRTGSVDVDLEVRDGRVAGVDVVRGREAPGSGTMNLGTVPADAAAGYLLDLARTSASGKRGGDAILPAMLADVTDLWRDVMEIARDQSVRSGIRKNALFWVGQEAAAAATEGLAEVAFDEDEEQDVRDAAVFALSQRDEAEGIPLLMELAKTARQADTRRAAMFWLAQSEDDRVLAFFEEVLLGRGGR